MPDHSFSKEICPNIQSEPSLMQLEAIFFCRKTEFGLFSRCLITGHPGSCILVPSVRGSQGGCLPAAPKGGLWWGPSRKYNSLVLKRIFLFHDQH